MWLRAISLPVFRAAFPEPVFRDLETAHRAVFLRICGATGAVGVSGIVGSAAALRLGRVTGSSS